MAQSDLDKRMEARRARVEAARTEAGAEAPLPKTEEPITDYWKMPKSGPRTTLLNSAWTWTLIVYVLILITVGLSIVQNGLAFIDQQSNTARIAIAVGLIYPAWRIGSMISKFMKKRDIGAGFTLLENGPAAMPSKDPKPRKAARPGSVEARMEERRARVEKARQDGKL